MRKSVLTILLTILFTMTLSFNHIQVEAAEHKLENIDIDVYIHDDGSATITEHRRTTLSEGTENYIVIENLGKSTIIDFVVTEGNETYTYVDDWDIDASREEKAFKNSIIETSDGYELSWGIGEYGNHEYIVEYTITDFIKQLDDSQILFWRFINDETNIPPEKVRVEVETDKELNEKTEKIWAFGFEGNIHFENGKVIAKSEQPLDSSNYVTILMKLPDGQFATNDVVNESFETIQEQAFEGSDYGKENGKEKNGIFEIIKSNGFIIILLIVFLLGRRNRSKKGPKRGKFKRKYKEQYYRDFPYNDHIINPYYILFEMGTTDFENMLAAFILKWLKDEKIAIVTEEDGFIRKKEVAVIHVINKEVDKSSLEGRLFNMLVNATNAKGELKQEAFAKYVGKHSSQFNRLEKDIVTQSLHTMINENYINKEVEKKFFFKRTVYNKTVKGNELETNFYKYINYLHDFSLLNEHEAINVKIWDDMMVWAAVLGLTDVVYKQLNKLYPQYVEESVYSPMTISAVNSYSRRASTARAEAIRTSGGGGSTSIGGGGGSFGGGSGGGTR